MDLSLHATLAGIHPRTEALVATTRDFDRKRTDAGTLAKVRRDDAAALVKVQTDAGFPHVSDGLFGFQDVFRPFSERVEGLQVGPITRWFDNNTFIRRPVVQGPLRRTGPVVETYVERSELPKGHDWKATLPGPYTFAKLADDRQYGASDKLLNAFARDVLAPEVRWLVNHGFGVVQFQEPCLVTQRPQPEEWEALERAYLAMLDEVRITSSVATYFGDASPVLDELFGLPVDFIGVDFTQTPLDVFAEFSPTRGVQAGLVDARNSLLEKPEDIAAQARDLISAGVPSLALAPSSDMEFLPRGLADAKAKALGKAATLLSQEVVE